MIYESGWWKSELLKRADEIDRRANLKRWSQASYSRLEIDIMTSCFQMRKLFESGVKVSTLLPHRTIPIFRLERTRPDELNRLIDRYDWWEHFDMDNPVLDEITLGNLCNSVIHSYLFWPAWDEHTKTLRRFVVASDWDMKKRNRKCGYVFSLKTFTKWVRRVGHSWPISYRTQIIGGKEFYEAVDEYDKVDPNQWLNG